MPPGERAKRRVGPPQKGGAATRPTPGGAGGGGAPAPQGGRPGGGAKERGQHGRRQEETFQHVSPPYVVRSGAPRLSSRARPAAARGDRAAGAKGCERQFRRA